MSTALAVKIMHAGNAASLAKFDPRSHGVGADLGFLVQGVRNMRDQRARLRAYLAALNTKSAIDAMRTIAMRTGKDRHRSADGDRNIQRSAAFDKGITYPPIGWAVGIAMRMTPRIVGGARYRHLQLELFVVRAKNVVGNRPIRAYAIARIHFEVGGVQTGVKRPSAPIRRPRPYRSCWRPVPADPFRR